MLRKLPVSLLVSLLPFFCWSNSQHVHDSLLHLIANAEGEERVTLYFELSAHITKANDSLAKVYLMKGREEAFNIKYEEGIKQGWIQTSYYYKDIKKPFAALEHLLVFLHSYPDLSFEDSIQVLGVLSETIGELGDYETAIEYRKKHNELCSRKSEPIEYYYSYEHTAFLYSKLKEYTLADQYYDSTYAILKKVDDQAIKMHCNNNMGYNFYKQKQWRNALARYNEGIAIFDQSDRVFQRDSLLYAIIKGNAGRVYANMGLYEEARSHYLEGLEIAVELQELGHRDSIHHGLILLSLTELDILEGKYQQVDEQLNMISINFQKHPDYMLKYYPVKIAYLERMNQTELALAELKKQYALSEKVAQNHATLNNRVYSLMKLQENRIKKQGELQSELYASNEKLNRFYTQRIVLTSIGIVVALLVLFIVYRYRQINKAKLAESEQKMTALDLRNKKLESERLQEQLIMRNKDLTGFAIDVTRKNEFIQELLNKVSVMGRTGEYEADKRALIHFVKSQQSINNNLKTFQDNVSKVNHEFLDALSKTYPDLTLNEKQLCALLRLYLSTKEIATVKNISPESVNVLRHRICKKMGIDQEINLNEYLIEFV